MADASPRKLLMGRIGAAHGIKGEVRITSFTEEPLGLKDYGPLATNKPGLVIEIESALARIENGSFGICEETEEVIEPERLRAIPWTRLSIEGAEIRESITKRYARGG